MTDTRDSLQSVIDAPLADQLWAELNHAIGYIAPTSLQGKAAREWVESLALRMNLVAKLKRDTDLQSGAGDGERFDALRDNCWGLSCFSYPENSLLGDKDVGWRVVSYHMAEPQERIVSESFDEDPRKAIDQAIDNAQATGGGGE